ncbi:MAG: DUF4440 domain-containing protein [Proteobacteria bacterium]|nr:DUF4440 domain-containing protein [Pseudomonadota bacterium]
MNLLIAAARLFGVGVVLALASLGASAADSAGELSAIHAADEIWVKAFNAGDVDTMVGCYAEHSVLLPPGAPPASGLPAIRSFFSKMVPGAVKEGLTFTLGPNPAGGVHGDFGWSSGTYVLKDKTDHVVETGKYLSVSKKKDGKWLYVRDTWNSDGPAPATEPASGTKK